MSKEFLHGAFVISTHPTWKPPESLVSIIKKLRLLDNDCPMCGENPAQNDSICDECRTYVNEEMDDNEI